MALTVRKSLRFRLFVVLGFTFGLALGMWACQARGQNNSTQVSAKVPPASSQRPALPPTSSRWECRKFNFGIANEPATNSVADLAAFLQAAGQAQLVSSGLGGQGLYLSHYDVIACRQP